MCKRNCNRKKKTGIYTWELLSKQSKIRKALNNINSYAGRLNKTLSKKVKEITRKFYPDILYLDSSLLGHIAEWCKYAYPKIKVITFFHNVELDFELHRLKSGKLYFLPSILSTISAEKKAVKNSDSLITLHNSDSERLFKVYHRRADYFVPVCIIDNPYLDKILYNYNQLNYTKNILTVGFIGTAFHSNIQAAKYIYKRIAPAFNHDNKIQFIIAGNGFNKYENAFNTHNLKIFGFIKSLEEFYNNVDVILSPIMSGSGMKVKIAEAFKYNKRVIASPLSLVGYEKYLSNSDVVCCQNFDEYISAINFSKKNINKVSTRVVYKKHYSDNACARYFGEILSSI